MGYDTDFEGHFTVDPPLNPDEVAYLRAFARTRHVQHVDGPYVVSVDGWDAPPGAIIDYNYPVPGLPGLWCQWTPSDDGATIAWDRGEKFYEAEAWLRYLIDTFLRPGATAREDALRERELGWRFPAALSRFTFDHTVSGDVLASGQRRDDVWRLRVRDNVVARHEGHTDPDEAVRPVGEKPAAAFTNALADAPPLLAASLRGGLVAVVLSGRVDPLVAVVAANTGAIAEWLRVTPGHTAADEVAQPVPATGEPPITVRVIDAVAEARSLGMDPAAMAAITGQDVPEHDYRIEVVSGGTRVTFGRGQRVSAEDILNSVGVTQLTLVASSLTALPFDEACSLVGEGIHTALRKAIDSDASARAWRAVNDLWPGEWGTAVRWFVESLGSVNIVLARTTAATPESTETEASGA